MRDKWLVVWGAAVLGLCVASCLVAYLAYDASIGQVRDPIDIPRTVEVGPLDSFPWTVGGVKTLVASLGEPWNSVWSSRSSQSIPGSGLKRVWFSRPGSAMMMEYRPSGSVSFLLLQIGGKRTCGNEAAFSRTLFILNRGLGLGSPRGKQVSELRAAWRERRSARILVPGAVITSGTKDGCILRLSFDAERDM